jgi:hypothetical protein
MWEQLVRIAMKLTNVSMWGATFTKLQNLKLHTSHNSFFPNLCLFLGKMDNSRTDYLFLYYLFKGVVIVPAYKESINITDNENTVCGWKGSLFNLW